MIDLELETFQILDLLHRVADQALEAAAEVCDAYAKEAWGMTEEEFAANHLANAIRNLKRPMV
jgi:hypothetical protein